MTDFREIFDVSRLEEHEVGHLAYILNSPSYERVFEPYLRRLRDSLNKLLLDPSEEREKKYPYLFVVGGIAMLDSQLAFFKKLIEETDIARISEIRNQLTDEELYNQLRNSGQLTLLGSSPEPAQYNPDEDF